MTLDPELMPCVVGQGTPGDNVREKEKALAEKIVEHFYHGLQAAREIAEKGGTRAHVEGLASSIRTEAEQAHRTAGEVWNNRQPKK